MNKEEKKSGVSIFGQSEYLTGADPIEEMFALNLGDFLSENLISEDLAKKISVKSNKKERLINQLKELIDLYSSKNTLCVLDFNKNEEIAIYTSIAKSIVCMLEVEECRIFFLKENKLELLGNSANDNSECDFGTEELLHNDIIERNYHICIPIRNSAIPIGAIDIKYSQKPEDDFLEVATSIANLLGTTITLQKVIEETNNTIQNPQQQLTEKDNIPFLTQETAQNCRAEFVQNWA